MHGITKETAQEAWSGRLELGDGLFVSLHHCFCEFSIEFRARELLELVMLLFVCGTRLGRWRDAICLSKRSGFCVLSGVVVNQHLAKWLHIVAATLLLGEITDRNFR
jgi:hypothetical protein